MFIPLASFHILCFTELLTTVLQGIFGSAADVLQMGMAIVAEMAQRTIAMLLNLVMVFSFPGLICGPEVFPEGLDTFDPTTAVEVSLRPDVTCINIISPLITLST